MSSRADLMKTGAELARTLDNVLANLAGERVGFALFLFSFKPDPMGSSPASYIANVQHEDMILAVKEWLARQDAGLESDPLGPTGRA